MSDALDRMDMHGAVVGIVALSAAGRIAGRAVTVKLGVTDGSKARRPRRAAGER